MFNDVNNIINLIIEFCRDNVKVLMIGGIALIVIIIVVSILKGYDDDEDDDYDYEDYDEDDDEEDDVIDENAVVEPVTPSVEPSGQELPRETHPIGDIIGEIANLPTQGMKELEIKIPGAELKITYSGDCKGESLQEEISPNNPELLDDVNSEGQDESLCSHEEVPEAISKDQVTDSKPREGKTYIKFGPNNNNVSKSGKVYTEKELEEQIKD